MTSNNYQQYFSSSGNKFYKGSTSVDSGFQEPIDPVTPHETAMEVNSYQQQITRKDIITDQHLQQQLNCLKQHQQIQQHMLLQQYQQQRQQLEQEHEKQLQEHTKYLRHKQLLQQEHEKQVQEHIQVFLEQQQQQKKLEQQRLEKELFEQERLQQIKNKTKEEESAIASSAVKLKLQEFVLTKKHREAVSKDLNNSPPQFRPHWVPNQGSLDQGSPPLNLSPPYAHHLMAKYEDDFPYVKQRLDITRLANSADTYIHTERGADRAASESNILKLRSALKQKKEVRRAMITHSPLVGRRDKGPLNLKRKTALSIDTGVCSSNPDSGPNSPPGGTSVANGSLSSLHSKEESLGYVFNPFQPNLGYPSADLLYTSPSMPNISLGRPPTSASGSPVSTEEELRVAMSTRLGIALPAAPHIMAGTLPGYFSALPVLDGEFPAGSAPAYLVSQSQLSPSVTAGGSPLASPFIPVNAAVGPTAAHPAHRLHRHRPLGRTHSAPLPLGIFHQQQNLLLQQQHEQYIKDQKLYVKQHIRQTVLQRSGSKNHMENVDEETEVKLAQEMKECREAENLDGKMEDAPMQGPLVSATVTGSLQHIRERDSHPLLSVHRDTQRARLKGPSHHRPLSRTQSSPLVAFSVPPQTAQDSGPVTYTFTTGLAYDIAMLKHRCTCNDHHNHLEHAGRIHSIWNRLTEVGLEDRCERVRTRKATIEELQSCHSETYSLIFGGNPYNRQKLYESSCKKFCLLYCGGVGVDSDTVWNEVYTATAARTAAGCVIEMACRVASGDLKNGFAVVRPLDIMQSKIHLCKSLGFCYFNSVAIAAKQLKEKVNLEKILIIDWDVHHGNGTQKMFYDDPSILYISVHRHDNGNFFPGTGGPEECGEGAGLGFNVNIAFGGSLNPAMGDAEYLASFRTLVMPIAREFKPECVLVSAGYDAAKGHAPALGGYQVSPECFGHMTRELMSLANGKIVLALEGGYDIPSICDCVELSVRALLGEDLPPIREKELNRPPCQPAIDTLNAAIQIQAEHWPCVRRYAGTTHHSLLEFQKVDMEEADTISALASLSMVAGKQRNPMEQQSEPMEEGT